MNSYVKKLLLGRTLFYGYNDINLPNKLCIKKNKIFIYTKNPQILVSRNYRKIVRKFQSLADVSINNADLIFLDNYATKILMVGYPSNIPHILVAIDRPRYWIWILLGLLRRVLKKQVKILNFIKLKHGNNSRYWLLIKTESKNFSYHNYSLSKKIGIKGFINFLNKKKIHYVLLRSFERLPHNPLKNGDFDFLISDKHFSYVKEFLKNNNGEIGIDLWSVSAPTYNGITYYKPNLAQKILNNFEVGLIKAKIPNKKDYLNSFIYHCLYHKGVNSGISSTNKEIETIKIPNNKYLKKIKQLSRELKVNTGSTMEELDNYLASQGWRPKVDTLSKIAIYNEWVKKSFIKKNEELFPFSIFILRHSAIKNRIYEKIKKYIIENKFQIIQSKILPPNIKTNAKNNLRGGSWKDHNFLENTKNFEPSVAIVIYYPNFLKKNDFTNLKEKIRKKFDISKEPSIVHSTDNQIEFWDYLECCFPKNIDYLKKKISNKIIKKRSLNLFRIIGIFNLKINQFIRSFCYKMILNIISVKF